MTFDTLDTPTFTKTHYKTLWSVMTKYCCDSQIKTLFTESDTCD